VKEDNYNIFAQLPSIAASPFQFIMANGGRRSARRAGLAQRFVASHHAAAPRPASNIAETVLSE
jgi:hypothetical protein